MVGAAISVSGISNIRKDIKKIQNIVDTEIDAALMSGGMIVEGSAKEKCPVDTGRLRASITTHAGESDESTSRTVCVGTNVEYASYVEFGTGLRGEGGSGTTRYSMGGGTPRAGMAAQPYLRPALDENRDKVVREVAYQLLKEFARKGYV